MGTRVVRDYFGRGPLAEVAADFAREIRQARTAGADRTRHLGDADDPVRALTRWLELATAAHLLAADTTATTAVRGGGTVPPDPPDVLTVLVRRAQTGDIGALNELKSGLRHLVPWDELEELAWGTRESWAKSVAGGRVSRVAARIRRLERTAGRLARPSAGPLERLLAGRVALAYDMLAHVRRLTDRVSGSGAAAPVLRTLVQRAEWAAREHAAAERALRAFQERLDVPTPSTPSG